MSTAKFDTLSNVAGTQTVPVATVAQGSAKAWVNFNGTGTVAIRASFNVTSITDNGTGDYTINFTTALSDANYSFNGMSERTGAGYELVLNQYGTAPSTSALRVQTLRPTVGPTDSAIVCVSLFR